MMIEIGLFSIAPESAQEGGRYDDGRRQLSLSRCIAIDFELFRTAPELAR